MPVPGTATSFPAGNSTLYPHPMLTPASLTATGYWQDGGSAQTIAMTFPLAGISASANNAANRLRTAIELGPGLVRCPYAYTRWDDDFNRANVGPPPSASWVPSTGGDNGKVLSNQLVSGGATGYGYAGWTQGLASPVCAVWTIASVSTEYDHYFELAAIPAYGPPAYEFGISKGAGHGSSDPNGTFYLSRIDPPGVGNFLSGPTAMPRALAAGDQIATAYDGTTYSAWLRGPAAAWQRLGQAQDATYANTVLYPDVWISTTLPVAGTNAIDAFCGGSF